MVFSLLEPDSGKGVELEIGSLEFESPTCCMTGDKPEVPQLHSRDNITDFSESKGKIDVKIYENKVTL